MKKTGLIGVLTATLLLAGGCGAAKTEAVVGMSQAPGSAAQAQAAEAASEAAAEAASEAAPVSGSTTVTVVSEHGVKVVPDIAEISFGVQNFAATAEEAQAQNTADVNRVLEALKNLQVEDKHIRTTGYDLYPRYDAYGDEISGYNMNTNLLISNQPIEKVGELVSACVGAGANQMYGISYTYSGYNEAYAEALGNATKAARGKAEAIAQATGGSLGRIVQIQEGYQDVSLRNSYQSLSTMAMAEEAAADSVSVMPGEVDVKATVTVTYSLD